MITIKYEDLNTVEKAETFRDLFGNSKFNKVKKKMAQKVHGGEKLNRIENMVEDASDDEYERLRETMFEEMDKLVEIEDATAEIELGHTTVERLAHDRREMAKDYLGEERYNKAVGYPGDTGWVNMQSLQKASDYAETKHNKAKREARKRKEKLKQKQREREERSKKIEELTNE